jgi:MFS family permease
LQGKFTLFILFCVSVLAFLDRQLLNILVGPIRADLRIDDAQFSLLQGAAFALAYCLAAFPIAWLSDRVSRKSVIGISVLVWSIATVLFGLASSLTLLMIARIAVALGEAGLSPAAISILRQIFPPARQPLAMGFLTLSVYIGGGISLIVGGPALSMLSAHASSLPFGLSPWRFLFILCGVVGVGGAILVAFMREPPRGTAAGESGEAAHEEEDSLRTGGPARAMYLAAFTGIMALIAASSAWTPSLFIREHGWTAAQTGLYYGVVYMICGAAGALGGGRLIGHFALNGDQDALPKFALLSSVMLCIGTIGSAFLANPVAALAASGLATIAIGVLVASGPYGFQSLFPHSFSARAVAIYFLVPGTLGAVLGPSAVPMIAKTAQWPDAVGLPLACFAIVTATWSVCWMAAFLRYRATA